MSVEKIPGFDALSDHDKAELRKFETYLNRRHDKPKEPQFVAYGEVYGDVVFEDTPAQAPSVSEATKKESKDR